MADGGELKRGESRGARGGEGRAKGRGAPPVDPNEETAPHGIPAGIVDAAAESQSDDAPALASAARGAEDDFPPGRCELCGWRNIPSAALCEGCGSDLQTGEPPPVDRFRPRRVDARWVVLGAAIACAAGVAYGGRALYLAGADERAIVRAEEHARGGRFSEAEEAFRAALGFNDQNARAWAGLAVVLLAEDKSGEARRAAERALAYDPRSAEAHAALGRILLREGRDLAAAETHLRSALSLKADLPDLLHLLAHALYASDQRREARTRYREALARDPRSKEVPASQLRLGALLVQLNLLGEAEEQLIRAEQGGAPLPEVKAALGDLEGRRGHFDKALALYQEALRLGSADPWVRFRAARVLEQNLHRHDEALAEVQEALRIDAEQPAFLKLEGMILEQLGQSEVAYRSYKRAEALQRDDAEVLRLLASIDKAEGRLSEARQHLERAQQLDTGSVETLVALAQVAALQKDNAATLRALERAADLEPGNAEVHYLRAAAFFRANDRAAAIASLVASAEADKKYVAPRVLLVEHLGQEGRYDDAARVLEELVGLRRDDLDLQVELARLWINHCTVRRYDAAIELLERVLEQDGERVEAQRLIHQAHTMKLREGQ